MRIAGLKQQVSCQQSDATVLDRAASQQADRLAIEQLGIPGSVLMENAARHVAQVALESINSISAPSIAIFCGGGNNGGDGYAAARHLHEAGARVNVVQLCSPRAGSEAAINYHTCLALGIPMQSADSGDELPATDLIIDALFGTGLDREITGTARELIELINRAQCPVLAVDLPSGLDCNTGQIHGVSVKAAVTVTFVALKPALLRSDVKDLVGDVVLADIGVSRSLLSLINAEE